MGIKYYYIITTQQDGTHYKNSASPLLHPVAARLWDANRVKYCCGLLCLCLQMCIGYQHSENSVNTSENLPLAAKICANLCLI